MECVKKIITKKNYLIFMLLCDLRPGLMASVLSERDIVWFRRIGLI